MRLTRRRHREPDEVSRLGVVARRAIAAALVALPVFGVLLVGVYPMDAWMRQRQEMREYEQELRELVKKRDELREQVRFLQTEEGVELLAREEYGLVKPGEEAYVIVDPLPPSVDLPPAWPFRSLARRLEVLRVTASDG